MPRRGLYRKVARLVLRANKEIVDATLIGVAAATTTIISIANPVNDYIGTVGTCPIGAKVKAVWLDMSYNKGENTVGRMDWYVWKKLAGIATPTPGATGGISQRKLIFLERKGLNFSLDGLLEQGGGAKNSSGWLMIPKRFQNMAEDDELQIVYNSSVVSNVCVKIIYKWYA